MIFLKRINSAFFMHKLENVNIKWYNIIKFKRKRKKVNIEENIVNIQNELNKRGYAEKSIDYSELQSIHKTYGQEIDEKTFAQKVLQLSYSSYMRVKNSVENSGIKVRILKGDLRVINQEVVEQIKAKLQENGYVGKLIDYSELQTIHRTYGNDINEKNFAQEVLELSYGNYNNVKRKVSNVIILKGSLKEVNIVMQV